MNIKKHWWLGGGGLFSPLNIQGLKVWYDMTDNSTISSTGITLTRLNDKSGNGNDSVPTGTARGTIATNSDTGKQVLTVNGTTNYLPMSNEITGSSFTIFIVLKYTPIAGTKVLFSASSNALDYLAHNGTFCVINNTTDGNKLFNQIAQDDSVQNISVICLAKSAGVALKQFYNGREVLTGSVVTGTADHKTGQLLRSNSGFYVPGDFCGFLYYDSYLSDSNISLVTRSLFNTHGASVSNKITCFGDSITVGTGATGNNGYANLLATALGKKVVKAGIIGSIFQNSTGASRNGYDRYPIELIEYNYNSPLYILYGANDYTLTGGLTLAAFTTQYDDMVADLISKGYTPSNIYLGTVCRRQLDAGSVNIQAMGDAIRTIGQNYGCKVAEIYTAFVNGGGDALLSDAVHPNDVGHALIRDTFLAAT